MSRRAGISLVGLKCVDRGRAGISLATYDCVLVHVRVRIRVHLCDGGERERIAPVARITDAMHPCYPSLSRPRASHFPFRPIALATMIRVRVVFAGCQPEALGHLRALQLLEAAPAASFG